ncbi:MAG: KamA family radical SAM protein [Pseudomonadales bacterium]|jgi:lysine 2,3-aminomutase|nr:KamA family radical SAM protein [Gammaproteobacteria bacterium]MBK8307587.1 KamA family radical SAM protein [Gammaproteobacteria bacterium]MBP6052618.1 KamA family radical SAM protein [Pseudomonadales bacterium]MBP6229348.1 KamA family radical SAM protein [Pseudomonadales bacterium]
MGTAILENPGLGNVLASDGPATVRSLPHALELPEELQALQNTPVPASLKPAVEPAALHHRGFDDTEFWRRIPAYREVSRATFLDYKFQNKQSITAIDQLEKALGSLVSREFLEDVRAGIERAPMNLRLSPYTVSRIHWENPYADPIRIQFVPVASAQLPDHPRLSLDSLHEQADSPTPGLTHRYHDKALFLPLDVCPVYCRFCTRSYAIGGDTDTVSKARLKPNTARWHAAIAYLASRPEIEDVVVSGGDAFMLPAAHLETLGKMLLAIPHIRRIRIATKGPAVSPMKILSDHAWTDALLDMARRGRAAAKEVCLHTHFNSPTEISSITREAMDLLFREGLTVRNQSVMIRGVNDSAPVMTELVKRLSYMNVSSYYVYQHDMVSQVEDMRTTVGATCEIERRVRGSTAGFNTPLFVLDCPGGGGKRDIHSHDHYNPVTGISVYRAPSVCADKIYLYFDPVGLLPREGRERWARPAEHAPMMAEAVAAAGLSHLRLAVQ